MKPTKKEFEAAKKAAEAFMPGFEVVDKLPESDASVPVQAQVQAKRLKFRVVDSEADGVNPDNEVVQVIQMRPKGAADSKKLQKSVIIKGSKVVGTQG